MSSWQGISASDYVQSAYVVSITRTCQTAGSILVLYDHVLTFDREVDYIWNYTFAFGSICYLVIRYIGDAVAVLNIITFLVRAVETPNFCRVYFFVQSWLVILLLLLIQLVIQLRLYAMYQQSKKLLVFMISGCISEISAMSVIMGFVGADAEVSNQILPGQYICVDAINAISFYKLYYSLWIPVIVFEGSLCLLALWVGFKELMMGFRAHRLDGARTMAILVKGNVGYFFCILLICILNVAIGLHFGIQWVQMGEGWPTGTEALIGCRLILSLRSSLTQDVTEGQIEEGSRWIVDSPRSILSRTNDI